MNPFAEITPERVLLENDYFLVIEDGYPVSPGHRLIVSKSSAETFFDLSTEEQESLIHLLPQVKSLIEEIHNPDGYNIGMNCGEAAGQSVMHFHCHVIPRYIGDVDNPRGGVRYCIPEKGCY